MAGEVLVPFVNYLVVIDNDGDRLLAKYYDGRSKAEQGINEASLFKKTKSVPARNDAEVLMMDTEVVVFRAGSDCKFFVGGLQEEVRLSSFIFYFIASSSHGLSMITYLFIYLLICIISFPLPLRKNELILVGVLDAIFDTVATLLRGQVDKRTMFDNLELVLLTIDEAVSICI